MGFIYLKLFIDMFVKFLLFPLAFLFNAITKVRNFCYDNQYFKSYKSTLKTIGIGNLQVGGSGKTPFTAWLYNEFKEDYKTGILSRGYGRKTKGLIHANVTSSAQTIGDEPFWYLQHLHEVEVVVAEKRKLGLQYYENSKVKLVLLDDAFQHRSVQLDVQIVLTEYGNLYFNDTLLPVGRLRESIKGINRADIIVVTKCPQTMGKDEKQYLIQMINPSKHQSVFFTCIQYQTIRSIKGSVSLSELNVQKVIALSSIANPKLFINELKLQFMEVEAKSFPDHFNYSIKEITMLVDSIDAQTIVITTEKDESKLLHEKLLNLLPENKFWVLPLKNEIMFGEKELLLNTIKNKLL
jgi:tetraacyldisaccharide 4'-kinase